MLPLTGDGGRVVKGKGPGGEHRDHLSGQGSQVPGQPVSLALVGAHQHHRPIRFPVNGRTKVGPVDRGQTGHRRRAAAVVHGGQQLIKFIQSFQCGQ